MDLEKTCIIPRLQQHEEALSHWRYEGEYSFYNPAKPFRAEHPNQLAGSGCFAWADSTGELLGHVSYGPDGQIPTAGGYRYSEDALDIGLGLRPDLCGQGLGGEFLSRCLRFAQETYGASRFRLSVAAFNQHAIRAYQKAGFSIECEVTHQVFHNTFYIMTGTLAGG